MSADLAARIKGMGHTAPRQARWMHVRDALGCSNAEAKNLCRDYRLSPDVRVGWEQCSECNDRLEQDMPAGICRVCIKGVSR